jgi:hypothetical protein
VPVSAGAQAKVTFTTTVTRATASGRSATLWFKAAHGSKIAAVRFYCALELTGKVVPPRPCTSPRHYTNLRAGNWNFYVYAVSNGRKSNTAAYPFTVG